MYLQLISITLIRTKHKDTTSEYTRHRHRCMWTACVPPSTGRLHILVSITPLSSTPPPHLTQKQQQQHACCCWVRWGGGEGGCNLVESGYRRATPVLAVSNGSASTLSRGALIDYRLRQHELTERQWLHTCCDAWSLARFGFVDDSRENGWSIGAVMRP